MIDRAEKNQFHPDWVPAPGATIQEIIDDIGLSQAELSRRMTRSAKFINELIQGKVSLNEETALQLQRVLGVRAGFWLGLETEYQLFLARQREAVLFAGMHQWERGFPFREMVRLGWITTRNTVEERVQCLLEFFGVATPDAWELQWGSSRVSVSFRGSKAYASHPKAVSAWLRQGQRTAAQMSLPDFDRAGLVARIQDVRKLTVISDVKKFKPVMEKYCHECGLAVIFVPAISGATLSGAAHWYVGRPIVQLSLRHKTNDHLWFSFFHEVRHILSHSSRMIYISERECDSEEERDANAFARDTLIPPREYKQLLVRRITLDLVEEFAASIEIAPGIVVGRLQHDGYLPRNHGNRLKVRYRWS